MRMMVFEWSISSPVVFTYGYDSPSQTVRNDIFWLCGKEPFGYHMPDRLGPWRFFLGTIWGYISIVSELLELYPPLSVKLRVSIKLEIAHPKVFKCQQNKQDRV